MSGWRHAGEWDPSAVDYELQDLSLSDHVALARTAKSEAREVASKLAFLEDVSALGAESATEKSDREARAATLRTRLRDAELRAAYLDVKLKDRLAAA